MLPKLKPWCFENHSSIATCLALTPATYASEAELPLAYKLFVMLLHKQYCVHMGLD